MLSVMHFVNKARHGSIPAVRILKPNPMRRKLFNLAAAISLVLCLAIAWVWRYPRSSGGVRWPIAQVHAAGRVLELSEIGGERLGGVLILGSLPPDIRQLDAQPPPAGTSVQRSIRG